MLKMIAGRFAEAATAKARATRNAMFSDCAGMARAIETAPISSAATRATLTSSFSVTGWSFLNTPLYRSCATEDDDASVSPATTARMVAKATAEISASSTAPPVEPGATAHGLGQQW